MVIWVTGVSGVGKTTLCQAVHALLKPRLPNLVLIDGDVIRDVMGHDLGFAETDRIKQVQRIQRLVRMLDAQGIIVLVAVLYANHELLAWNRDHFSSYREIYIKASLETLLRRDPKGLYAEVVAGRMANFVGFDIPWHEPEHPDVIIDADHADTPDLTARRLIAGLQELVPFLGEFYVCPAT